MPSDSPDGSVEVLLRAMLALQIADRDATASRAEARRTELVLADAGMSLSDIANVTGRNYETVKTAVRRGRASNGRPRHATDRAKRRAVRSRGKADG